MEIIVLHNQSILDIAIQHTGSVFNAFAIAFANGFSVSEILVSGTTLIIPDEIKKNEDIFNYYTAKGVKPATSLTDLESITEHRGIGWMKVGSSFKVG